MFRPTPAGPSLGLLWRLAAIPAALLVLCVVLSIVFLLPWGPRLTDDRLGALWVLLASLIATVGAAIAALLSASSEERTREMERDRDARQSEDRRTTEKRQRLESTIQGIRIFEVAPDNQIMAAGAFAMVLRLGEPEVALRMLGPALRQNDVDASTAAWVIDRAFLDEHVDDAVKDHAAFLLMRHARQFTSDDVPGAFNWPSCLQSSWPEGLDENTGGIVILALADLLTARSRLWWAKEGGGWNWAVTTLYLALRDDPHEMVKSLAAWTLRLIYSGDVDYWAGHWISGDAYQAAIDAWGEVLLPESRQQRLRQWISGDDVAQPTMAEAAAELAEPMAADSLGAGPTAAPSS